MSFSNNGREEKAPSIPSNSFQFNIALEGPDELEEDEDEQQPTYTQWANTAKNNYFPEGNVKLVKELKPGVYGISWSRAKECYFAVKKEVALDELFVLPDVIQSKILNDMKVFWEREDMFKKYKYAYKRGILLWGAAGNGKSSIINLLTQKLVKEYKGVIFTISESSELSSFMNFMTVFKQIQPKTRILCIIEDIENLTYNRESEGMLLNLLDGINQIENIVFLATTNYPEELKERILNRPSRFDRRYELKVPIAKVRKAYFKAKLKAEDLVSISLEYWVKETKGFSIAHLGEVVKSVFALGNTFDETVKELKAMDKKISSFDYKKGASNSGIGFNNKDEEDEADYDGDTSAD